MYGSMQIERVAIRFSIKVTIYETIYKLQNKIVIEPYTDIG